jgi:large subunit ribosomal protein L22
MTGAKTNERAGTRATLRGYHMSASKARVVLNLIRNEDVTTAREILADTSREAADVIGKVLASAIANAVTNDGQNADDLYVSAAYADEGVTMKRFTPRARGRAGKILKRSCHITVIVSRLDDERLEVLRSQRSSQAAVSRTRRVASSRRRADQQASLNKRETAAELAAQEAENEVVETDLDTDVDTDVVGNETETAVIETEAVENESEQDVTDEVEATDDEDTVEDAAEDTDDEDTVEDAKEDASTDTTEETN